MKPVGDTYTARGRGRGPWRQGQDYGELRRPHSATTNVPGLATPDPGAGGDAAKRTTLSPDAKEFFPKGYQSRQFEEGRANPPTYRMPTIPNWASRPPLQQGRLYSSCSWSPSAPNSVVKAPGPGGDAGSLQYNSTASSQEQFTTHHLYEVMQNLTLNPGRFDAVIDPLAAIFSHYHGDMMMVQDVVNAVVEQSIMEPNFRYNGARLCVFLRNASTPEVQKSFRNCILKRCQEEDELVTMMLNTTPQRVHGYTLFLAELYIQMEVIKGKGERFVILGHGLINVLGVLLSVPTPDNVKCACQALKLAGLALDKEDPLGMSKLFDALVLVPARCPEVNIQYMVNNVMHLRQCAWGNAPTTPQPNSSHQLHCPNEPVFYGPDGQILTAEESRFLQENVGSVPETEEYDDYGDDGEVWMPEEEEDEEFEEAYEEFLKISNQTKKT